MKIAGGAMLKVKDIMTRELITVSPEAEIVHATKLLLENRINGVPVTDETGKLVGILCQSDLIAQQKHLPHPLFFHTSEWINSSDLQETNRKAGSKDRCHHRGPGHDAKPGDCPARYGHRGGGCPHGGPKFSHYSCDG